MVHSVEGDFQLHREINEELCRAAREARQMRTDRGVARIEILHLPDCPLVDEVRETVRRSPPTAGCSVPIEELEGDLLRQPEPTVRPSASGRSPAGSRRVPRTAPPRLYALRSVSKRAGSHAERTRPPDPVVLRQIEG
jgi:hypothetical protein